MTIHILRALERRLDHLLGVEWQDILAQIQIDVPEELIKINVRRLDVPNGYQTKTLEPYRDKEGNLFPNDNIGQIITSANMFLKKIPFKTHHWTNTRSLSKVPQGLHLFQAPFLPDGLKQHALREMQTLFWDHAKTDDIPMTNRGRTKTNHILFYSLDKSVPQPTFSQAMQKLHDRTPNLAMYILHYCAIIMKLFQLSTLDSANLTLIHYDRGAGLNAHIDSIFQFGNTIGPICTIAMGRSPKMFDMLPTLTTDGSPIRIYSQPDQLTIMDGISRVAWSHALPWGYDCEQWTVAIKFPALDKTARIEPFEFDGVQVGIPYYL